MPFVGSVVEPTSLSRRPLPAEISSFESEAIVNNTLASVLRQLASVSLLADEIFSELRRELRVVSVRASSVVVRLKTIEDYVVAYDPKAVLVPESDMCAFSRRVVHFASQRHVDCALFTASSRPCNVRRAYERAASPGACAAKQPRRGRTHMRRRLPSLTMETTKPAVLSSLRRWTWAEAVGSVTCEPGANAALAACEGGSLHALPSPDEVCEAVARTFPGYTIALDTSGRLFDRQSSIRRSRGPRRGRRRNTVAGGDIGPILAGVDDKPRKSNSSRRRSKSESRLAGIKDWGRAKLRSLRRPRSQERQPETLSVAELSDESSVRLRTKRPSQRRAEDPTNSSSGNWSASSVTSHTKSSSPGAASRRQSGSSGRGVSPDACCHSNGGNGFRDDDDSVYSCDTEGYYTSFHVDSGLKEVLPATAERSTTELCNQSCESQYQLFGKGSTSTTASSNNTVCTALLNPAPPPRLSSLGTADAHSLASSKRSHSVSSHSLAESNPSSESTLGDRHGSLDSHKRVSRQSQSDARNNFLNGTALTEQSERRKVDWKSLNARRIPSMCVVTPPTSDDEPQPNLNAEIQEMADKSSARIDTAKSPDGIISDSIAKSAGKSEKSKYLTSNEQERLGNHLTSDGRISSLSEKLSPNSEGFCSETESVSESANINKKTANPTRMSHGHADAKDEISRDPCRNTGTRETNNADEIVPFAEPEYATLVCRNEPMSPKLKERDTEYVSLKELKTSETSRTGARVTLDAAGQVVFCSDSLRRTKKSFEPGATRPASQEALGRSKGKVVSVTPVRVVRPTQRGSTSPTARNTRNVSPGLCKDTGPVAPTSERIQKDTRTVSPVSRRTVSPVSRRTVSPTSRKEARTVSPLLRKEYRSDSPSIGKNSRTVSPISRRTISPIVTRETSSPTRHRNSPGLLQTSFDDPVPTDDDEISPDETDSPTPKQESPGNGSEVPPRPANPEQLTNYLQRTNPALFRRINEPKIHRTDSYKMANVSNVPNARHIVVPTVSRAANTKRVKNPNLLGRKVYGTEIRVDPKLLPTATERAKVLSAASPVTSATSSTPTRERGVVFDVSLSPIGPNESRRGASLDPSATFARDVVAQDRRYYRSPAPPRYLVPSARDALVAVQNHRHGDALSQVQRHSPDLVQNLRNSPVTNQNQRYSPNLGQNQRYSPNFVQNQRYSPNLGQNPRYSPNLGQNQRYSPNFVQNQRYSPNLGQNQRYSPNLGQNQRYSPNLGKNEIYYPNLAPQNQIYIQSVDKKQKNNQNVDQNQRFHPNSGQNPRYSPNLTSQNPRHSPNLLPQVQRHSPNILPQGQRHSPNILPQLQRHSPNFVPNLTANNPNTVPNTIYYCQNLIESQRQSPVPNSIPTRNVSFGPIEIQRSPLIGRDDFRLLLAKHSVDQSQKLSAAQRLKINQSEKSLAAQRFGIDQSVKKSREEQLQTKENIEVNGRPSFETAL